jgi:glycosyltransferase involved in cell wall biosynthesis
LALPFAVDYLGWIDDDLHLRLVYNAADLLVGPSLQDNFPNVFVEAMACGLPAVGFDVGGIPEIVKHGERGYIAKARDTVDLCDGIQYVLQDIDASDRMSKNARAWAEAHVSQESVARMHMAVYRDAVDRWSARHTT